MKKILICSHAMDIGGAERALLNLLYSFDYKKYQVDLFLMRHQGELMKYIPKEVCLLPEIKEYTCLAVPILDVLNKKKLRILYGRIKGKIKAAFYVKRKKLNQDNGVGLEYSHKYTCKYMPVISNDEYDLAISFLTPHYFVRDKVIAKKKIAWIHTDYSYVETDVQSEYKMWNAYDYVASISDTCTEGFCNKFPELRNKIIRIDNILSTESIKIQADEFVPTTEMPADEFIKLLSVGRFCHQKNFDNVPDICKRIHNEDLKVKWYLIGFGPGDELIRKKIKESGIEEFVVILGKKENPYPYMKMCDLYIQPSRYEGNCVSVHEAQALAKPVVITNYSTATSQLTNGVDGVIVPMDNKGCADEICKLLKDMKRMRQLQENCAKFDYSNAIEVEKIYRLMED